MNTYIDKLISDTTKQKERPIREGDWNKQGTKNTSELSCSYFFFFTQFFSGIG